MKNLTITVVLSFFITLSFISEYELFAQQTTQTELANVHQIQAYRLAPGETVNLDGRLDEPFWDRMNPITNFRQQEPVEGGIPSERTEVYVAYDNDHLYIGAKLFDSEPDRIIANQKRRNANLNNDDRFQFIIDTFNTNQSAYFFETNPAGLLGDGLISVSHGTSLNKAWDGIWDVRTTINDEGWIVEIIIPFRTLDFNPENDTWGINFLRTIRRNNEDILWTGWRRNQAIYRPQDAGELTGLEGLSQGLGLEVTPYLAGSTGRAWQETEVVNDLTGDAGFDATYNITPSIRTSLTINTDFAETEVDQRRVNLSRFPLVFPEQRDFFLEGSNIFVFAPRSQVDPFFSRRIGLVDGESIPLNAGAKVLGRSGDTTLGFYQIRTGRNDEVNPEDFTVARISQNILEESSIGAIYTRRATIDDEFFHDRHTLGTDLELSTSRFLGDKNLHFQSFFVWHNTHTPVETTNFWDRSARGIRLSYPNYPFSATSISYREYGNAFSPAVGIAPRVGVRRFHSTINFEHFFNENDLIRSNNSMFIFRIYTNMDFEPETINLELTALNLRSESGENIRLDVSKNYENLGAPFDVLRDGQFIIPPGDYHTWNVNLNLNSAGYRRISGSASIGHEGFWTGERTVIDLSMTTRPLSGINLSGNWSRSNINLAEDRFHTDLFRFTGNIDLTSRTAFTSILQFDNVSELMGLYNRFRWNLRPGADLYLVHTFNWIRQYNHFSPLETEGAVKFSITQRF